MRRKRNSTVITVVMGVLTVFMFALATVHFAAVSGYTFREFAGNWAPDSTSRGGSQLRILGMAAGSINVCSRVLVSKVR